MRLWLRVSSAVVAFLWLASAATAADLRFTYAELANVVQAVIGDAKLHLNTKPGGFLSAAAGSYIEISGSKRPVTLPAKSFALFGSTYAYFVYDLNSSAIRVAPTTSGVRLTLDFEGKDANIAAGCVSGECALAPALPKIVWKHGTVAIDIVPVLFGSSVTLQVQNVSIGGLLSAHCDPAAGLFSSGTCSVALSWANRSIAKLKPDIAASLKTKVNAPETQTGFADSLKKYLVLGQAGEITVTSVSAGSKSVTISFRMPGNAGG